MGDIHSSFKFRAGRSMTDEFIPLISHMSILSLGEVLFIKEDTFELKHIPHKPPWYQKRPERLKVGIFKL